MIYNGVQSNGIWLGVRGGYRRGLKAGLVFEVDVVGFEDYVEILR